MMNDERVIAIISCRRAFKMAIQSINRNDEKPIDGVQLHIDLFFSKLSNK
jgi:hypothetical protein